MARNKGLIPKRLAKKLAFYIIAQGGAMGDDMHTSILPEEGIDFNVEDILYINECIGEEIDRLDKKSKGWEVLRNTTEKSRRR